MEAQGGTPLSCPLCSATFSSNGELEKHRSNPDHIYKWLKHWYYSNKMILGQDKNNVKISIKPKENIVVHDSTVHIDIVEGEKIDVVMTVENSASVSAYLRKIGLLNPTKNISLHDEYEVAQEKRCVKINPGVMYEVTANVTGTELGVTEVPVAFQLRMEDSQQLFFIVKTVVLSVEDSIAKDCAPEEPYIENKLRYSVVPLYNEPYERGIPPPYETEDALTRKEPMKHHHYPYDLVDIANKNFDARKLVGPKRAEAHRKRAMLDTGLTLETYREWFQTMLWLEEMQVRADFTSYNMENSSLTKVTQDPFRHCIALEVPGLAENRPSVLRGDSVFVKLDKQKEKFEGRVHHVVENKVYLAFGPKFMKKFIENMKVRVEFSFCRLPLRCAHEAVCMAERNKLDYLLFPTKPTNNVVPPVIRTMNKHVEGNPEQLQAVRQILCKSSLPGPYVIFGPPGTGKTITIVEAMKQVYKRNPESHIVACAPSNTAADLIALRLLEHVSQRHMLRMYAASKFLDEIPDKLKVVSNVKKAVYYPSVEVLKTYQIIVCTLVTAARLVGANFPDNHFSYIFIDESGQATEAETMIPIAGLATRNTQVVMAGDPQQLGPVIRNTKCSSERFFTGNGLDKSYLERLMEMEMFKSQDGVYDARVVTKLLNNYRSHEAILKLPNNLFYQSELKVCANEMLTRSLCNWRELPKKNFPLIFQGVRGKDEKESFSPSYFNAQEVSVVVSYIKKLLDIKNPQVVGADIGVITPYRRQVQKIKKQVMKNLPQRHWASLKVGTPEEFQGNERKIIIISTVRATASYLEEDNKFKIGFLKNPKRFNVALTRAKALVIVVGQAEVLQFDPFWSKLYTYIKDQGGYVGHNVTKQPHNVEEIIRCFSQLNIGLKSFENVGEPSGRELAEAPGWGANI